MQQKDTDPISEFEEIIENLYGLYLDSTVGLVKLVEFLNNVRTTMIQKLEKSDPKIDNPEYLDNQLFIYGEGNPNTSEALKLHECTQYK